MPMGGEYLSTLGTLMPGGIINGDDHRLAQCGRLHAGKVPEMSGKGTLQPCGLRVSRLWPLALLSSALKQITMMILGKVRACWKASNRRCSTSPHYFDKHGVRPAR